VALFSALTLRPLMSMDMSDMESLLEIFKN
jgi:hypothetical protein